MRSKYFIGISWFIMSLVISSFNDVLVKLLSHIPSMQVAFLRFSFGCISLLPFLAIRGSKAFKTTRIWIHIIRGAILFAAMSMWCCSLSVVPIVQATLITFTIPLFVLLLAKIFLNEKITPQLLFATFIGFFGAVLSFDIASTSFNILSLLLLISAFLFASLDIINKKFAHSETMLSMLFYSALVTAILGAVPAYLIWQDISIESWLYLMLLGIGSNLILYCLIKALQCVQASDIAPYRYIELVFSGVAGIVLFNDVPSKMFVASACLIIPSTIFIAAVRRGR